MPGQFVMVWIPGVDEVPMSISYSGAETGITVEKVGKATEALHALRRDDLIGLKGPLGKVFTYPGSNILVVGGGSGMGPLASVIELCAREGKAVTCIIGARDKGSLLFEDRVKETGTDIHIATDNGSAGHHGFVTELARQMILEKEFDQIITCGPEPMMVKMVEMAITSDIHIQCSLERYMKCGIGLCGSCQLGKYQVCRDGPVFDGKILIEIPEFGRQKRDVCGRLVDIQ